jgi:sugar (pentulose or hexulose) kinase
MKEVFLGIDCATQSSRSVLIDSDGAIYTRHSIELAPVLRGSDGRLTQRSTVLAYSNGWPLCICPL